MFHPLTLTSAAAAEETGEPLASKAAVPQQTETCPAVPAQPLAAASSAWQPTGLALRAMRRLFQQELSSENYALGAKLGEGTFGYVFRGTSSSGDVAVKVLKGRQGMWLDALEGALVETQIHEYMGVSPQIARLLDVYFDAEQPPGCTEASGHRLVFELLDENLSQRLRVGPLSTRATRAVTENLVRAVAFLHSRNIIHTDISAKNVLLAGGEANLVVKLCDMGAAEHEGARTGNDRCEGSKPIDKQTLWYRSPEIMFGCRQFTFVVDEWSVGCILYECLLGQPLFKGAATECSLLFRMFKFAGTARLNAIFANSKRFPHYPLVAPEVARESENPDFPKALPEEQLGRSGKTVLLGLLQVDPEARLTAQLAIDTQSYVQRRPILTTQAKPREGERGRYLIQETELHPELRDAMRSDTIFTSNAAQTKLELGWNAAKGYKETFRAVKNKTISDREQGIKTQVSGNAGLPTLATSLNSLEINEELPHSENTVATVQAFHKLNSESISHLKSFLLREIAKDIPRRDWPEIDNIDRLKRNLADFLYEDVRDASNIWDY